MTEVSAKTLVMAIQGVDAEIQRIKASVDGHLSELEADDQELLFAFSQAATELKQVYAEEREASPDLPNYDDLVHKT